MKKIIITATLILALSWSPAMALEGVSYGQWQSWTFPQKMAWLDAFRGGFCAGILWGAEFHDRAEVVKKAMVAIDESVKIKYGEAIALIDFQWVQDSMSGQPLAVVAGAVFSRVYDVAFRRASANAK